jgi:hypothetical protein
MGDPKDKNIYIHLVEGGDSGKDLLGCWYIRHGNTYDFYDKDRTRLKEGIKVDEPFEVVLDGLPDVHWNLAITNPVGPDKLAGIWSNNIDPTLADGSYQAEAGGTGEEEDPHAASAGAY